VRWTGHVAHIGDLRNVYKTFIKESEDKRPLGRLGLHGRMLQDMEDCIYVAQDRVQWQAVVNTVMKLWVPYTTREFPDWQSD
jgi:hypothetical protein